MKKSKNQDSGKSEVYNFKCSDETQVEITKSNQSTYIKLYNLIFSEPEGLEGLSMALQAVIAGGSGLSQSRGSINFDGVKCSIKIVSAEPKMTKSKMPLGLIALYDEAVEINLIYERTRFDSLVNTIETLGKTYIENLLFKIELNQEELKKVQDSDLKRWICYDYSIENLIK